MSIILALFYSFGVNGQTTTNPSVRSKNNNCTIESVTLTASQTVVKIRVPSSKQGTSISSATVMVPSDEWDITLARQARLGNVPTPSTWSDLIYKAYQDALKRVSDGRQVMSEAGFLIRSLGDAKLDQGYQASGRNSSFVFTLYFDRLPYGVEDFYIRELQPDGKEWVGIKINNPYPTVQNLGLSEYSIKPKIDEVDDGIVGIYEQVGDQKYKLGCVLDNDTYKLVYLGSGSSFNHWRTGDVKAVLRSTATPGLFKADWRMSDKSLNPDAYITFDGMGMKTVITTKDGVENDTYLKMYPTGSSSGINPGKSSEWSGSGFALRGGYIVTNYHVVDGAKSILIYGINGDMTRGYVSNVYASDKTNDLAIIQITDSRFNGFGAIPYAIKSQMLDVGEDAWVLGYPLTQVLGNEIKLTTGVISSRSGYQGDLSTYQISAPVQPGNSGGPLFDSKGNIVGVVNASVPDAENVGYAIKSSYLVNLIESYTSSSIIPSSNTVSSLSRPEQIKRVRDFVFLIECSSKGTSSSSVSSSSTSSSNSSSSYQTPQVHINESIQLSVPGKKVTSWSVSKPSIASISPDGVITGLQEGKTGVWATLSDGKMEFMQVTVKPKK